MAAAITMVLDAAKGCLAVLLATRLASQEPAVVAMTTAAVVLGYVFPVYLSFKGDKDVATSAGAFPALSAPALLVALLIFGIVLAWTRVVSLGSITVGALIL